MLSIEKNLEKYPPNPYLLSVMKRTIGIITTVLLTLAAAVGAAPASKLWDHWQASDYSSSEKVDHSRWDRFLARYVDANHLSGINQVAYSEVSSRDKQMLDAYLADLQNTAVLTLNREEQEAFWINLYNAFTVKLILDHYPISSILKIRLGGPWKMKLMSIDGQELSLNDIEHRILRPIWKDPRLHYAVNCASMGCPNLQPVAFTAENIDSLLDKGAREYINHARGVRVEGGKLLVSSIYKWFKADFGGSAQGVREHLYEYASPELRGLLHSFKGRFKYGYDWDLNED